MSGICGLVRFDGRPVLRAELERMLATTPHRGPDGTRRWVTGSVGLAHQAQHVTPESVDERQPVADDRTGITLVADARIDERVPLLRRLRGRVEGRAGAADPATPDAELLAAALAAWGPDGWAHVIGDVAVAAWCAHERRFHAARDLMGLRPLYYHWDGLSLAFGSEVKQVLAAPGRALGPAHRSLVAYLVGRFDDPDWTSYEEVRSLPAGHLLTVDAGGPHVRAYAQLTLGRPLRYRSDEEYVEHFRDVFREAVRARLRSVRPVGILLSGGVDSGSVAAMAGQLRGGSPSTASDLRAYSWRFDELTSADERHISGPLAAAYGIGVGEIAADHLWPLVDYPARGPDRDEPFVGPFQPLFERALAQARADGLGVVMTGHRGDLIVGADVYDELGLAWAGRWGALHDDLAAAQRARGWSRASVMRRLLLAPLGSTIATLPGLRSIARARRRLRAKQRHPPAPPWVRQEALDRARLDERPRLGYDAPPDLIGAARTQRYRALFMGIQMRSLLWAERNHANAGVGFADAWSDRRVAEFVLATPQWRVNRRTYPKALARAAMRGVVPESVRHQMGKISPEPLFRRGLADRAETVVRELLTRSRAEELGLIDSALLLAHFEEMRQGARDHPGLWFALTLEMWLRRYAAP